MYVRYGKIWRYLNTKGNFEQKLQNHDNIFLKSTIHGEVFERVSVMGYFLFLRKCPIKIWYILHVGMDAYLLQHFFVLLVVLEEKNYIEQQIFRVLNSNSI